MVIGMAGGVGSGKSTVLSIMEQEYPVQICMADELGHAALEQGTEAYGAVVAAFGEEILHGDGRVDRNALSDIVYRDGEKLSLLNGIIHPYVKKVIRSQIDQCPPGRLFVLETAILFESGCDKLCDEVWGVITEDEIRIRRLMESRGYTREKAESIMKKQMGNGELAKRCQRLIVNDGDREELRRQIGTYANEVVAILSKVW